MKSIRNDIIKFISRPWVGHLGWVLLLTGIWIFGIPTIPREWGDGMGLISMRSLAQMVTALTLIQALGGLLNSTLGTRAGIVMTGLLGGLISSTAVTATAARKSRGPENNPDSSVLLFAYATLAMLLEGVVIIAIGLPSAGAVVYAPFVGPILVTVLFAVRRTRKIHSEIHVEESATPEISGIIRVSIFLAGIIAISKLMRHFFGKSGLLAFTVLASFFEIHATLISNTALRNSGDIQLSLYTLLIAVSLGASYLSKLLIVRSIGSPEMFRIVRRWTAALFLSLIASAALAFSLCAGRE